MKSFLRSSSVFIFSCLIQAPSFAQQFTFNELVSMIYSFEDFEKKMFAAGNTILEKSSSGSEAYYSHPNDTMINIINDVGTNNPNLKDIEDHAWSEGDIDLAGFLTYSRAGFAEGYNRVNDAARTWYDLFIKCDKILYPYNGNTKCFYFDLTIRFFDTEDYLQTLRQMQSSCDYITTNYNETREVYRSKYVYKEKNIRVYCHQYEYSGGEISIKKGYAYDF